MLFAEMNQLHCSITFEPLIPWALLRLAGASVALWEPICQGKRIFGRHFLCELLGARDNAQGDKTLGAFVLPVKAHQHYVGGP
jgi:hypothetical protein